MTYHIANHSTPTTANNPLPGETKATILRRKTIWLISNNCTLKGKVNPSTRPTFSGSRLPRGAQPLLPLLLLFPIPQLEEQEAGGAEEKNGGEEGGERRSSPLHLMLCSPLPFPVLGKEAEAGTSPNKGEGQPLRLEGLRPALLTAMWSLQISQS